MSTNSKIEWTDHTSNLWWGCEEVAPECDNCYAREWAKRFNRAEWGGDAPRVDMPGAFAALDKMQRDAAAAGTIAKVFVGSMMDIGEKSKPLVNAKGELIGTTEDKRRRLFYRIDEGRYPNLLLLLLSKRPQNYPSIVPLSWLKTPPANVMYGATAGTQKSLNTNSRALLRIPGRRFLSMEPLLEAVDFDAVQISPAPGFFGNPLQWFHRGRSHEEAGIEYPVIHWVIVGGESGNAPRPMRPEWAFALRDQCVTAGTAFFFKQWGEWTPGVNVDRQKGTVETASWFDDKWMFSKENLAHQDGHRDDEPDLYRVGKHAAGRLLDGRTWDEMPEVSSPR